jgi:hypothetical protein
MIKKIIFHPFVNINHDPLGSLLDININHDPLGSLLDININHLTHLDMEQIVPNQVIPM